MVRIQLKVKNSKEQEFLAGFLRQCPIPERIDPGGTILPQLTLDEWLNEWVRIRLTNAYGLGKQSMAKDVAQIDVDLFEK